MEKNPNNLSGDGSIFEDFTQTDNELPWTKVLNDYIPLDWNFFGGIDFNSAVTKQPSSTDNRDSMNLSGRNEEFFSTESDLTTQGDPLAPELL